MTSTGTGTSTGKQTVLLIGVGLMGGDLLYVVRRSAVSNSCPADPFRRRFKLLKTGIYEITVLARSDDTLSVVRGLGVKTVKASLQDAEVLTKDVSRRGAGAGAGARGTAVRVVMVVAGVMLVVVAQRCRLASDDAE
jgi:hypothetical protein